MKPKKNELIESLNNHPIFKEILGAARNETERRMVKAHAEDFIMKFHKNVYSPMSGSVAKDPESLRKAFIEIDKELINESTGQPMSGSK